MSSNVRETRREVLNLKDVIDKTTISFNEMNEAYRTYLALARKTGLPENIMQSLVTIEQLRVAFRLAKTSALEFYYATGPIGWIIGFGGMALSGLMLADQMEMRRPRY